MTKFCQSGVFCGGGREQEPWRKGWEVGGKRAGSGILKVAGTGRKRVKFCNISLCFRIDIRQTGENSYGKAWEAGGSDLPVPLHYFCHKFG